MAAPLAAQPTDILRTVAGYLTIQEGARATGAVGEMDKLTKQARKRMQLEQWSWLFPDLTELSFEEGEERLRPFEVSTLNLTDSERTAWRAALHSLEHPPSKMSEAEREEYIESRFPLHLTRRSWSSSPTTRTDEAARIYDRMLLPEVAQPHQFEVARTRPLRLALVESDFTTVLTTFALDSTRFDPINPEQPGEHSLVVAAISRGAYLRDLGDLEEKILGVDKLPIHDRTRNLLLVALLAFGWAKANPNQALLGPLGIEVARDYQGLETPALAYQALSMGGYNFLEEPHPDIASLFVQELESISYPSNSDLEESDNHVSGQDNKILRMEIILDRLQVQGQLEVAVETGWGDYYSNPPEPFQLIPLEALLWSTHRHTGSGLISTFSVYRSLLRHLIERGVQSNRLRDKIRSLSLIERQAERLEDEKRLTSRLEARIERLKAQVFKLRSDQQRARNPHDFTYRPPPSSEED